jgi:cell wall-active antibiotic response 4TMS protein YvqF
MGQFRPLSARRVGQRRRVSTFGLILILLGLIGLLVTYSFLPGWVPRFWPLLIVAIGLFGLFRRPAFVTELDALIPGVAGSADRTRRRFSLVVVGFGLLLLVFTSHLVDERIAGPAVIIALGIALLWRRYR